MAPSSQPSDGTQSSAKSVAVVGAGISGLVAAYQLKLHGLRVTLFESNQHPGGKIRTNSENGIVWEEGANTMTESDDAVGRLLDGLCLREKQQFPISQNKRYIVKNGKPELIPSNPLALIQSKFLSSKSKLQILMEPFLMGRSDRKTNPSEMPGQDLSESVGMFFKRHFGQEVVDYLIDPFVAGTSGGDPESLSMHLAFPEIFQLEKMYGSIILGFIKSKISKRGVEKGEQSASRGKSKHSKGSFSFQGGLQVLTDKLCTELTNCSLKLHSEVLSLSYNIEEGSPTNSWLVSYTSQPANDKNPLQDQTFDAVVMTAPLCSVQQMQIEKMGRPFLLDFLPKASIFFVWTLSSYPFKCFVAFASILFASSKFLMIDL
ncbi:protoporphyrinogen oxidase, mitochondrial [Nymphaea colorata]|nr:protoporphyrinogen oxidase, mitochondrial [Nymphaea colorata]